MKKLLLILLIVSISNSSCSNNDDSTENIIITEDFSKIPNQFKGTWKVDYHALESDPTWIANNNGNYYLKFSEDNLTSYKDSWTSLTNELGKYYINNSDLLAQFNQLKIFTKISTIKPGYTEFHIIYQDIPEKSNILFAKKQ